MANPYKTLKNPTEAGERLPETSDPVTALQAENTELKAAQQAQQAQNDTVLDYLGELREEIATLKAGQGSAPVELLTDAESRLTAEWAALKDEFKDIPNIDVIEHRVTLGSDAPAAIRLKAQPGGIPEPTTAVDPHGETCYWKLRWFNFAVDGRAERFASEGYLKVERAELADPDSIPNMALTDQYVRKGTLGQEVLGKIPRKLFEFKKRRDAVRQGHLLTSETQLRAHLSNQVASLAGKTGGNADQAGSTVHGKFNLSIKKGETERVTY